LFEPGVIAQHAIYVRGVDLATGLDGIAETGVTFLIKLALFILKSTQGGDVFGNLIRSGSRQVKLIGKGQTGDTLQCVLLGLCALQGIITRLELGAETGIEKQTAALFLIVEIYAEEGPVEFLMVSVAASRVSNREHERDRYHDQEKKENQLGVFGERALNPGNHGGKRPTVETACPLSICEAVG
jgi:hypothetical protein